MKTILLPTDFSPTSESALNYTLAFAEKMGAKLILFNTYPVPVYVTDMPVETSINQEIKTEAEVHLKKLEEHVRLTHPNLETETLSAWGFAADEIIFQAKEKNVDFVLMGTHGAEGLKKLILGTNTAEVVNKAQCAVLAIPDGYIFNNIGRIAFATNCRDEELPAIIRTAELASTFGSTVILLHVGDGILNSKLELTTLDAFKQKVIEATGYLRIEIDMIEIPDFIQGLTDYVTSKGIDLLALGHHKRSYFAEWLHPSISKKIAYKLPSPLLALPI